MQFVKTEDLKAGMRLARPIYNKQGVLLFERDSKLTSQGIASIANFGLIGLFILEPAEPVPPMTKEDLEFERFQTMAVFAIEEELKHILRTKKIAKMQVIANNIIRHYGHLDKKINFNQSLRSREDYFYKHSLNVAILCTMISHVMNVKLEDQQSAVLAAVVHDIGKLSLPEEMVDFADCLEYSDVICNAETGAYDLIENVFVDGVMIRRVCSQSQKAIADMLKGQTNSMKMVVAAKILAVADMYDSMTAMKLNGAPMSEVLAIRYLLDRPETFDPEAVNALIKSINVLSAGVSVELNTGEKALVLRENPKNILRPMLLSFQDNTIVDLEDSLYSDIEIVDVMKTMDNRYLMNMELIEKAGIQMDKSEFI